MMVNVIKLYTSDADQTASRVHLVHPRTPSSAAWMTRHEHGSAMSVSVILVEQNAMLALTMAQRSYVLETGYIVMQSKAQDLLQDEEVKKVYLGL